MPVEINLEPGSMEWLEWRRTGIGGSDANIIASYWCGTDYPYGNWSGADLYKLFCQKTGRIALKATKDRSWGDYVDPRIHGQKTEDEARRWYSAETGFFAPPVFMVKTGQEHLMASLDGWEASERIFQEFKCPKEEEEHRKAKEGQVPERYLGQMIHNLNVCEGVEGHFVSYFKGEGVILPVKLTDMKFFDELRAGEEEFMSWVKNDTWPMPKGDVVATDKKWATLVKSYFQWQKLQRECEKHERSMKRQMMQMMMERGARKITGAGIKASMRIQGKAEVKAFTKEEFFTLSIQGGAVDGDTDAG